jgi:hypothetical protein
MTKRPRLQRATPVLSMSITANLDSSRLIAEAAARRYSDVMRNRIDTFGGLI